MIPLVATAQREAGIGGHDVKVMARDFHCVQATVFTWNTHSDVVAGGMTEPQLKRLFLRGEGFTVVFAASGVKIALSWRDMVELARNLFVFGPP